MSFAASTVPGSKHQFRSTLRRGDQKKIITPRKIQMAAGSTETQKKRVAISTADGTERQPKSSRANNKALAKETLTTKTEHSRKEKSLPNGKEATMTNVHHPKDKSSINEKETTLSNTHNDTNQQRETIITNENNTTDNSPNAQEITAMDKEGLTDKDSPKIEDTTIDALERPSSENSVTNELEKIASKNAESENTVAGNGIWITSKKFNEMVFLKHKLEQRIESLEADLKEVLNYYEMLYKENEMLKEKLNIDEQLVAEPYKTVLNDRGVLRNAELNYKKRITQLQREIKDKDTKLQEIKEENQRLKTKLPNIEKEREKEAKYNKMFWENRDLNTQNHSLIKKIGILTEDLKFYKSQKLPDWDGVFIHTGESLLHKLEQEYGNDQRFEILEHEAKKLIADLEESVETLTTTVENLKIENKTLIKTNKELKTSFDEAIKKYEDVKKEKVTLEKDVKMLNHRIGANRNPKENKMLQNQDYAKILTRLKGKS